MNKKIWFSTIGIGLLLVNTIFEFMPWGLVSALVILWYLLFFGLADLDSSNVERKNRFLQRQNHILEEKIELQENEIKFLKKKLEREQRYSTQLHDTLLREAK